MTAAIRDITVRKKAEAHLLQKVDELNRSNEELGQFAYIASHDLQEPLRMVASYTQLLSRRYKGKLDADADEFIAFAVDGANRMQRLIQDLLAYSRVGTKGKDLLDTSSEDALEQALINLRGAIEDSGALVTHDPLPTVLADETQLIQLFQNLVGNAIKYQRPGIPQVHVSAARNGDKKWIFSVQGQRAGNRPAVLREDLWHVPAAAQTGRVRRHRHRAWPSARRSSSGTAAASRSSRNPGRVPPFASPWQEARRCHEDIAEETDMPVEVLLVEDSPGDVRLTQEAFRDANRSVRLHVATDGVEAMAFLRREGMHADAPSPGSHPAGSEPSQDGWP